MDDRGAPLGLSAERLREVGLYVTVGLGVVEETQPPTGDLEPAVVTVTLDRPAKRNAQTPQLWYVLADVRRALPGSVRVVVIRGGGPSFSAGIDLAAFGPEGIPGAVSFAEMARMPDDEAERLIERYQAAFDWRRDPAYVSIAAVQGHAVGAGFQLALGCDLRVLAEDAQLAMAETGHGIVPDLGGTKTLVDTVGYARALEICGTGRRVAAREAHDLGLAQLVVPRDELDAAVADLTAALLGPPRDAVRETKALLLGAARRSYDEQCAAERTAQVRRLRDLAGLGE